MSGSSGSSFGGDFEPAGSCESLAFETQLSSPKDDVVDQLQVGDILDVTITQSGSTTVLAAMYQGRIAGGIAAPQTQRLRECILGGTKYSAVVLSINGGQVRVRVTAR